LIGAEEEPNILGPLAALLLGAAVTGVCFPRYESLKARGLLEAGMVVLWMGLGMLTAITHPDFQKGYEEGKKGHPINNTPKLLDPPSQKK